MPFYLLQNCLKTASKPPKKRLKKLPQNCFENGFQNSFKNSGAQAITLAWVTRFTHANAKRRSPAVFAL
ncbi:MAG: hypothetical protein LBS18_06605 [Clostridiales bacterium]|jgi:hypothetical protein|nr:hypothetical protein [Clostridiales bacterium]